MLALLMGAGNDVAAAGSGLDAVTLLRDFGFPVFVAVWFMWRIEQKLDKFTNALEKLYTVVTIMAKLEKEEDAKKEVRP